MKKMILALVAVFSMSVSSFAANSSNTSDNSRDKLVNVEKSLNLDGYQSKVTAQAGVTLQNAIKEAMKNTNVQERNKEIRKALLRNLRSVRGALDYSQYKKYVQVMNTTLNNRGLQECLR